MTGIQPSKAIFMSSWSERQPQDPLMGDAAQKWASPTSYHLLVGDAAFVEVLQPAS